MESIKLTGYAFVSHVDNSINPEIEINFKNIFNGGYHSQLTNLMGYGHIKLMGYLYDATDYLNKYLVKQYGTWHEYYAPNKTLLRKSLHGKIDKIVQLN